MEETQRVTLYEMVVDGQRKWCSLSEAARWYDSGQHQVAFGQDVIQDGWPRPMTDEEQRKISDLADDYGSSK